MKTVKALIEATMARLQAAGIAQARWDAELLVAHGLKESRLMLYAHPERGVDEESEAALLSLVGRRVNREPLQHLIGLQEFWGLAFNVGRDVFIPRPETELLIEAALASQEIWLKQASPIVADIGTGSGCLAVALAKELPQAQIYATDLSSEALVTAEENAKAHGVSRRIRFLAGDLYEPLKRQGLAGQIDLIVSNPPYIPRASLAQLQPEVRDYEPRMALDGGLDGLSVYRRLLAEAPALLAPRGVMILELGHGQADEVRALATRSRFMIHRTIRDGAGIPRVLTLLPPH